jgi:hypothetical protein
VALPGQGAPVRQLQIALRPLKSLDRRLFVDTENNRFGGRIDVKADHIGGFRHERGVVALAQLMYEPGSYSVNISTERIVTSLRHDGARVRPFR